MLRKLAAACFAAWAVHTFGRTAFAQDAPQSDAESELADAEKQIAEIDFERAIDTLERVRQRSGLTRDEMIRVYRNLAVSHGVLGHEARARELFVTLLALDRDYRIDPNISPRAQAPYFEARGFWTAQTVKPGIEATAVVQRSTDSRIRVTLRDPTHLTRQIVVGHRWDGTDSFIVTKLPSTTSSLVTIRAPVRPAAKLEFYARALDEHDNVVFESGTPDTPLDQAVPPATNVLVDTPPSGGRSSSVLVSPVFWTVTALVLVGGATGAYFATRSPDIEPATSQRIAPVLTCGGRSCQ